MYTCTSIINERGPDEGPRPAHGRNENHWPASAAIPLSSPFQMMVSRKLDLAYFIRRKQTLQMYKSFIRCSYQQGKQDPYLLDQVRFEFKRHKGETNESLIKHLVKQGEFQLKNVQMMHAMTT